MSTARQAFGLGILLFVLAYVCWYGASSTRPPALNESRLLSLPDHRFTALTVQQFDTTGRLIHQLTTPFMQHFPKDNVSWMKQPQILVTELDQPTWNIQANEASTLDGDKRITFQHEVLIHHGAYENNPAGTIQTDHISYFPHQKLASTNAEITWTQPGNIVQSTGMNAYLDKHQIDLLQHARAIYEPAHG
jgi:lipopolysaccharide export system protein LptC